MKVNKNNFYYKRNNSKIIKCAEFFDNKFNLEEKIMQKYKTVKSKMAAFLQYNNLNVVS